MKNRNNRWSWLPLVVVAAIGLALFLQYSSIGRSLELYIQDARSAALLERVDSDITIVAIDARSIAELNRWPWPRSWHAQMLKTLRDHEPARVFYDVDFSAESDPFQDAALAVEFGNWQPGQVALPAFWQTTTDNSELVLTQPAPSLRSNSQIVSVNMQPAADGIVRNVRTSWEIGDVYLPAVVEFATGTQLPAATELLIDYSISPESFTYLSFIDVMRGEVNRADIAGRTIYIGATSVELGDMLAVPNHGSLPGVVVQALAAATVSHGVLQKAPIWLTTLLVACWSLALTAVFFLASWRKGTILLTIGGLVLLASSTYLFAGHRIILELTPFLVSAFAGSILAMCAALDAKTWHLLIARLRLGKRQALIESIVESSADSIIRIDANGIIEAVNSAALDLFTCRPDQLTGKPISEVIPAIHESLGTSSLVSLADRAGRIQELEVVRDDGTVVPVETSLSEVQFNGETMYVAILRDIAWRKAKERELEYLAAHDPLTDLPNRLALSRKLKEVVSAQKSGYEIALLVLDLDRFKEVNDTLGHSVGDNVLQSVSRRFQEHLDEDEFIARLGGDEFAIVVHDTDARAASAAIADRLWACLKEPLTAQGISIELGVSIGIAFYPTDGRGAEELLKSADVAMYEAKRRGGGFAYYDAEDDKNSVRRLGMVGELRSAIANDELSLYFQPKIDLQSGAVEGAEALLRWEHASLGKFNPEEFISIVEATDLIRPLTKWTLQTACAEVKKWRRLGIEGPVAVNLSTRLLQDRTFPDYLKELLATYSIGENDLELEITESAVMLDPARAIEIIQRISSSGVKVSIDDFGTGYSSLAYLRDLPLRSLKIDKSFVMQMQQRKGDRVIVDSTIQMAQALGMQVVAEGVETSWIEVYLQRGKCDFAQGYLYSRALPGADFLAWCAERQNEVLGKSLSETGKVLAFSAANQA